LKNDTLVVESTRGTIEMQNMKPCLKYLEKSRSKLLILASKVDTWRMKNTRWVAGESRRLYGELCWPNQDVHINLNTDKRNFDIWIGDIK
jgi:hypothetical protein